MVSLPPLVSTSHEGPQSSEHLGAAPTPAASPSALGAGDTTPSATATVRRRRVLVETLGLLLSRLLLLLLLLLLLMVLPLLVRSSGHVFMI